MNKTANAFGVSRSSSSAFKNSSCDLGNKSEFTLLSSTIDFNFEDKSTILWIACSPSNRFDKEKFNLVR